MITRDALAGIPFEVDRFRCYSMGAKLSRYEPLVESHAWSDETVEGQFVFKLLFVSVCHQFNWDFLQDALTAYLLPSPHERLAEFKSTKKAVFDSLLAEYPKPERWRSAERASYLRKTASELEEHYQSVLSMLRGAKLAGPDGYYKTLDQFTVFREDSLKKKSRVLAHDLYREGTIAFSDPENLKPAVEYHLIRLYLRTGRVRPTHPTVRRNLLDGTPVERDRLVRVLRKKVSEAMELTAFYSGLDSATVNYVEWQIARSVCDADSPTCAAACLSGVPDDVARLFSGPCLFADECSAFQEESYGMYREPKFQKAIY